MVSLTTLADEDFVWHRQEGPSHPSFSSRPTNLGPAMPNPALHRDLFVLGGLSPFQAHFYKKCV